MATNKNIFFYTNKISFDLWMLRLHVQQTIKNNEGKPNDNCLKNGRSYMK